MKPKSIEIHLSGRKLEKIARSIDGECIYGRDPLPERLPGETDLPSMESTLLEDEG